MDINKNKKIILIYLSGIYTDKILFLVFLTGLIGGIWLTFLREFSFLFVGLIFIFSLRYVYKIINIPISRLFQFLVKDIENKKRLWIFALGFFTSAYDYIFLAVWVFMIFNIFFQNTSSSNLVPIILWSYAVILGSLVYMSLRIEKDKRFGISVNFLFTQLLFFLILSFWLLQVSPLLVTSSVTFIFSALNAREELLLLRKKNQYVE